MSTWRLLRARGLATTARACNASAPAAAGRRPQSWQDTIYWNDKHDSNEPQFKKVLVANRGEIACRVMSTCRRLGIRTVAVHSDIDSLAKHVQMADEAVCIGPAQSAQSYLKMENILEAVRKTGADAVHPGYGFLSENTVFAARLAQSGVAFVGPNSKAINALGDKIESKRIATKAKVNMIPGFDGEVGDAEMAVQVAKQIGFPVMMKASAGGGGKGMRVAWNEKQVRDGYRLSRAEARSAFGDDRMLVEKYFDGSRHIEIQVLADKHGNALYLNERECSVQRRNQKVVEEAPSTFVTPDMRRRMGEQAAQLALAVGYDSAGTVEFLVDNERNFYFLEMNTRLQVEHPITEFTTGVDIVHQMLRVAKGNKLLLKQSDISVKGHAIESRVYAEDPYKAFGLPSVGRLHSYKEPTHIPNVRCDSGIREGSEISIYYDPLICKLITYGPTRDEALATMRAALDQYVIRGVTHNIALLRDIVTEKNFIAGNTTTKYLPTTYPDGFRGKQLSGHEKLNLICIASIMRCLQQFRYTDKVRSWKLRTNFQDNKYDLQVHLEPDSKHFVVEFSSGEHYRVPNTFTLSSQVLEVALQPATGESSSADETLVMQLIKHTPSGQVTLQYLGTKYALQVYEQHVAQYLALMPQKSDDSVSNEVRAPMPGLLKSIAVTVGQILSEGQEVCVLEAMKMQNSLLATKSSKVKKINFKAGDTVAEEDVIVELE